MDKPEYIDNLNLQIKAISALVNLLNDDGSDGPELRKVPRVICDRGVFDVEPFEHISTGGGDYELTTQYNERLKSSFKLLEFGRDMIISRFNAHGTNCKYEMETLANIQKRIHEIKDMVESLHPTCLL